MYDPSRDIRQALSERLGQVLRRVARVLFAYRRTTASRRFAERRALYGCSDAFARSLLRRVYDQRRYGSLGRYIWFARRIPGWIRGEEVVELARVSAPLPYDATVVEIGSFRGQYLDTADPATRSTVRLHDLSAC
jgi:hypothetical protein